MLPQYDHNRNIVCPDFSILISDAGTNKHKRVQKMKIFDHLFKPYSEYCTRTIFSEDELKEIFEKEFPLCDNIFAGFKTMFERNKVTFSRSHKPLVLNPVLLSRNSMRGEMFIECEKAAYSDETILHISITPPNQKIVIFVFLSFYIVFFFISLLSGAWQICIPVLLMPVFLFLVLAVCRNAAESEIPLIRQAFENTLLNLEYKYENRNDKSST